jgi:hypothetical protein
MLNRRVFKLFPGAGNDVSHNSGFGSVHRIRPAAGVDNGTSWWREEKVRQYRLV